MRLGVTLAGRGKWVSMSQTFENLSMRFSDHPSVAHIMTQGTSTCAAAAAAAIGSPVLDMIKTNQPILSKKRKQVQ